MLSNLYHQIKISRGNNFNRQHELRARVIKYNAMDENRRLVKTYEKKGHAVYMTTEYPSIVMHKTANNMSSTRECVGQRRTKHLIIVTFVGLENASVQRL